MSNNDSICSNAPIEKRSVELIMEWDWLYECNACVYCELKEKKRRNKMVKKYKLDNTYSRENAMVEFYKRNPVNNLPPIESENKENIN